MTERRWLQGRLERMWQRADERLRDEIDTALAADLAAAAEPGSQRGLEALADVAAARPAGMAARVGLVDALSGILDAAVENGEALRPLALRRDGLLLDLARCGD